jgi:peptide/nickel transport system permease protein
LQLSELDLGQLLPRVVLPATCLCVICLLVVVAILAPVLAPHDPQSTNLAARLRPPAWFAGGSATFPLGTDGLGYDILSRMLFGARISLTIGLSALLIGLTFGAGLGLLTGYFRGATDALLMLLVDAQLALPFILIAIAAAAAFGKSVPLLVALASLSGLPLFVRAVRSSSLGLAQQEFMLATRAVGASDLRVLMRHMLPNLFPLLLTLAIIDLRRIILFEASLNFIGLGVQPPEASWGSMINDGRQYLTTEWWIAVFPGLALLATILAISLLGDWLRDRLQPDLRA